MGLNTDEIGDFLRFWLLIAAAVVFCVYAGRVVGNYAPPFVLALMAGSALMLTAFLFPKIGLSIVVFSMIFSPRLAGGAISSGGAHGEAVFKLNDILLIIAIFTWLARGAVLKTSSFIVDTPINLPIMAFSAVLCVSTGMGLLRAGGPGTTLRTTFYVIKYIEYYLLFFMTINIATTREDVARYLKYGLMTALFVTVFAYTQVPGGQRVTLPFDNVIGSAEYSQNQSEPNTFGGYYLVVFSLVLGFFTQGPATTELGLLACLAFMIVPFLMTESRSSYFGFLGLFLFHLLATGRHRLVLLLGGGVIAMLVMAVPQLRDRVVNRVAYTFTGQGGGGAVSGGNVKLEGSALARATSWSFVFKDRFPHHPFLGFGVTGVGLCDTYYPLLFGEVGLVGAACFFWLLFRIGTVCRKVYVLSGRLEDKALALGVATAIIGLLLQSVGANTFIIVRIMEPFWFATALLARSYLEIMKEQGGQPPPAPARLSTALG